MLRLFLSCIAEAFVFCSSSGFVRDDAGPGILDVEAAASLALGESGAGYFNTMGAPALIGSGGMCPRHLRWVP